MIYNENDKNAKDMIHLIMCLVNGKVPDKAWCENLDIHGLFQESQNHQLVAVTCAALENANIRNERFYKEKNNSIQRTMIFDAERKKITKAFEEHGIWYALLKGAILQKYYPQYGLRQMSDNDILIMQDQANDIRTIMEGFGYKTIIFGNGEHDIYQKKPFLNFEMHPNLIAEFIEKKLYDYYVNIWERLNRDEKQSFEAHFRKEDFYGYLVAHEYKHFINGGTGLRSLLDVYLFLKKEDLNWDYVHAEMTKMGIDSFEKQNRMLAQHLFGGEELTESEEELLQSFIQAGAYGSLAQKAQSRVNRYQGSKLGYMVRRLAIPIRKTNKDYARAQAKYPLFYKYKVLLPFLPLYRIIMSIRNQRFKPELKAIHHKKTTRNENKNGHENFGR